MKKGIVFLLIIGAVATTAKAQAQKQSLKDLLYGGKLKMDSNSVIRKGDDLSSKIDTSTKKQAEPEKAKPAVTSVDSSTKKQNSHTDSVVAGIGVKIDAATTTEAPVKETVTPVKSNTRLWKEYSDSLVSSLKTEVLSSKKIKKETYYLMVDYEIGTEGQVNINAVTSTPENSFLQDQVKERILAAPLQLAPAVDSAGKPRKVKRKYSFTVTKE